MADNVSGKDAAGTTYTTAADDIGGVLFQRVKLTHGVDGTATDTSAVSPFPTMVPDEVATGAISATDAVVAAHGGAGALLTGTPTANSYVAQKMSGGDSVWTLQLTGTFGGGTVWFECSADSTNGVDGSWTTLSLRTIGTNTSVIADSTTVGGLFRGNPSGVAYLRVRVTGATTPSIAVVSRAAAAAGPQALNAPIPAGTNEVGIVRVRSVDLSVTATAAAAAAVTLTLPAPGAGLFHHITGLSIVCYSTAARTGGAAPVLVTTTNLPGSPIFSFPSAGAVGTQDRLLEDFAFPIKSAAANTATTVVAPATTAVLWRIRAHYFTAA